MLLEEREMKRKKQNIVDELSIKVFTSSKLTISDAGVEIDSVYQPVRFSIEGYLLDGEDCVVTASGVVFDRYECMTAADEDSQDMAVIAEMICKKDGSVNDRYANMFGSKACFMERLLVPEKYRNCGIASALQKNLRDVIQNAIPDICGIYAYAAPWELKGNSEKFQKRQAELVRYYRKFGFKQVKGSQILWMPVPEPF